MPPAGDKGRGVIEPPVPESPVWLPSIAQGRSSPRAGSPGPGFTLPKTRHIPVPTGLKSNAELFSISTMPSMDHLDIVGHTRKKVKLVRCSSGLRG